MSTDHKSAIPGRIAVALSKFPPFSMLEEDAVTELASHAEVLVMGRGKHIWNQGEAPPTQVLFLARGRVEYVWDQEGSEERVDVRDVGDLLGLTALIDTEPHRVTARVVEDSLFYSLEWSQLQPLIDGNDTARNYTRRHMFWATRVGRDVSIPLISDQSHQRDVLQAHLLGSQRIQPRPIARLVSCLPDESIENAAKMMVERRIPSMLVVDEQRHPLGILTHTNIVKATVVGNVSKEAPVSSIMSSPVVTVEANSSSTEAILVMMRKGIGQVAVTEDGTANSPALDVCSNKDLLAQSGQHPAGLLREIKSARTTKRFRWVCDELEQISNSYLKAGISPTFLGQICAEIYDALTQRLIEQSLEEMKEDSIETPTTEWAWLSVGSDGRREQVLRTDMDNAIVFTDQGSAEGNEAARKTIVFLAERVISKLVECGFSKCQGGVMALNPKWCRSDKEWIEEINGYQATSDSDTMLRALVIFDLRHVAGNEGLSGTLRKEIFRKVGDDQSLQTRMAQEAVATPTPLNFLGKLIVEKKGNHEGQYDIKGRGLSPIRDAVRILALREGVDTRYSTGGRLELLARKDDYKDIAPLAAESYDFLLRLRTATGLKRGDPGRYIEPSDFSKMERSQLANALDVTRLLQQRLKFIYNLDLRSR